MIDGFGQCMVGAACRDNTWSSSIEARGEIQFLAHIPDPSSSRSRRGSTPICAQVTVSLYKTTTAYNNASP
jgi:hypothetical protein